MKNSTKRILHGEDELRTYSLGLDDRDDIYTASDIVVDEIDKIVATGKFPYNSYVARMVALRIGIPEQREGSNLYGVVYASQGYRRHMRLVAEGFEPFTDELLRRAYTAKANIEVALDGLMGESILRLNVRMIGDKLFAMQPGKRKYHVPPQGQPARLVEKATPVMADTPLFTITNE